MHCGSQTPWLKVLHAVKAVYDKTVCCWNRRTLGVECSRPLGTTGSQERQMHSNQEGEGLPSSFTDTILASLTDKTLVKKRHLKGSVSGFLKQARKDELRRWQIMTWWVANLARIMKKLTISSWEIENKDFSQYRENPSQHYFLDLCLPNFIMKEIIFKVTLLTVNIPKGNDSNRSLFNPLTLILSQANEHCHHRREKPLSLWWVPNGQGGTAREDDIVKICPACEQSHPWVWVLEWRRRGRSSARALHPAPSTWSPDHYLQATQQPCLPCCATLEGGAKKNPFPLSCFLLATCS